MIDPAILMFKVGIEAHRAIFFGDLGMVEVDKGIGVGDTVGVLVDDGGVYTCSFVGEKGEVLEIKGGSGYVKFAKGSCWVATRVLRRAN